ncbi:hypothetical protein ACJX0J_038405, partial [Zea mays]
FSMSSFNLQVDYYAEDYILQRVYKEQYMLSTCHGRHAFLDQRGLYNEILLHYLKIAALNHGLYYSILVSSFHATSSFKYPESSNSSFMFINSSFMIYVQDRYLAGLYFM